MSAAHDQPAAEPTGDLVQYDAARREVGAITSIEEAQAVRAKLAGLIAYYQQAGEDGRAQAKRFAALRDQAEARLGELLEKLERSKARGGGDRRSAEARDQMSNARTNDPPSEFAQALADHKISRQDASRFQARARATRGETPKPKPPPAPPPRPAVAERVAPLPAETARPAGPLPPRYELVGYDYDYAAEEEQVREAWRSAVRPEEQAKLERLTAQAQRAADDVLAHAADLEALAVWGQDGMGGDNLMVTLRTACDLLKEAGDAHAFDAWAAPTRLLVPQIATFLKRLERGLYEADEYWDFDDDDEDEDDTADADPPP